MHEPQDGRRAAAGGLRPYRLRAVLFDFDGTLTQPGALDFAAVKRQVGCPPDRLVLEFIDALDDAERRQAARAALERFELEGAAGSRPNEGAEELVDRVRAAGLRVGVLTRNGRAAVLRALEQFEALDADAFDALITRDDGVAPKPSPDGVLHACEAMGVTPAETLVVGDFLLDVQAGNAAGAVTAFLANGGVHEDIGEADLAVRAARAADVVVHDLAELAAVVELGLPLPEGKLSNELLARHLRGLAAGADVVVAPAVGEDVAVLDVAGAELATVHGDPITLSTATLGRSAVLVNANDIVTAGALPRWLFTTVLLPPGTTGSQALALLGDIADEAAVQGIALAGGHTEVTPAVARPVVSATMVGVVRRADLREKRSAREGDDVVLTKGVAVEGTALLAHELRGRLEALGVPGDELDAAERLAGRIAVVAEARIAAGFAGVRAMHDVTEGGLATAVRELAAATGHDVVVHIDAVPVLPETRRLCDALGADPLGLIGSGSLLVCCDQGESGSLVRDLRHAGIAAAVIGRLGGAGAGVTALRRGVPAAWPSFAADEAARLLAGRGR